MATSTNNTTKEKVQELASTAGQFVQETAEAASAKARDWASNVADKAQDVAAAVEYDSIHCATHEFNFPDCAAICRSVADIDAAYIRRNSRIGDSPVDVVFGGAPCQGFSMIGKRALDDPRNSLVHHFVRLVVELNASHFVFENVRGLTLGRFTTRTGH